MLSRCLKPPAPSTFGTCSCSFLPSSRTRILMRSVPLRCRDSWCGKCKRILAHTVEAMVGDKPARVNCKTCKSQHSYKPHPLDRSSQRARKRDGSDGQTSQPAKPPSNRYNSLLRANNTAVAETYSPQNRYEPGDVLEHPTFGRGITTAVKEGTKIKVLFESGSKTLIHGRRPSLERSFGY